MKAKKPVSEEVAAKQRRALALKKVVLTEAEQWSVDAEEYMENFSEWRWEAGVSTIDDLRDEVSFLRGELDEARKRLQAALKLVEQQHRIISSGLHVLDSAPQAKRRTTRRLRVQGDV